jgi:short-subunit dehydrogenase
MLNKPVAVVTGASRGIGAACLHLLRDRGFEVIGTSRTPTEELSELDLSNSRSIKKFCSTLTRVDLLISNAGISQIGAVEDVEHNDIMAVLRTNLTGAIELDSFIAQIMRKQGGGRIIHISSLAARLPVPYSSIYASSKAGLDAYSFAFANEVRSFGIEVCSIYFDFVRTTLPQHMNMPENSVYAERVKETKKRRDRFIASGMLPERVAGSIVAAALRKRRLPPELPIGSRTRLLTTLIRFLPRSAIQRLIYSRFNS